MNTLKVGHLHNFFLNMARHVNQLRRRDDIDAVLVLLDLDDGCAAQVAQKVAEELQKLNPPRPIAVVFAVREYEAWFLAAAHSIGERLIRMSRSVSGMPKVRCGAFSTVTTPQPPARHP